MAPDLYRTLLDLDPHSAFDESEFERLFDHYRAFLLDCKTAGLHIVNPGRYALDRELLAEPLPRFIPLLACAQGSADSAPGSWGAVMSGRYQEYVTGWVKPFLQQVFERVDHQLVLVDLLGALGNGKPALEELRRALARVLQLFHYGRNSWLDRLIAPKVEELSFVATKLDCVLPAQRQSLSELMRALVAESVQAARFESTRVNHLELAAVATTRLGERAGAPALWVDAAGGPAWLSHPDLPRGWPSDNDWARLAHWQVPALQPPALPEPGHNAWPTLHLDRLCQLLLEDFAL